jgi:hypothetical protein
MNDFMDSSYGGHWQYLTILSCVLLLCDPRALR